MESIGTKLVDLPAGKILWASKNKLKLALSRLGREDLSLLSKGDQSAEVLSIFRDLCLATA